MEIKLKPANLEPWFKVLALSIAGRTFGARGKAQLKVRHDGPVSEFLIGCLEVDPLYEDVFFDHDDDDDDEPRRARRGDPFRPLTLLLEVTEFVDGEHECCEWLIKNGWEPHVLPWRLEDLWDLYGQQPGIDVFTLPDDEDEETEDGSLSDEASDLDAERLDDAEPLQPSPPASFIAQLDIPPLSLVGTDRDVFDTLTNAYFGLPRENDLSTVLEQLRGPEDD